MDWKFLLGLELEDPGFGFTVLGGFRFRLIKHGLEEQVLDVVLARLSEAGVLRAGGRQRTDSTHVLAAVRTLNLMEFVGETLRAALEVLAAAAPDWLAPLISAALVERMAPRLTTTASRGERTSVGNGSSRSAGTASCSSTPSTRPSKVPWSRMRAQSTLRRRLVRASRSRCSGAQPCPRPSLLTVRAPDPPSSDVPSQQTTSLSRPYERFGSRIPISSRVVAGTPGDQSS